MRSNAVLSEALLRCSQAGILIVDAASGLIVTANPAACIILGRKEEDLIGSKCHEWTCDGPECPLLNADLSNGIDSACEDFFKGEDHKEMIIERDDGTKRYVIRHAFSFMWDDRRHIIESLVDITSQKETELKYRDLVEYAPAGIYEVDYRTGKFTSINDLMCEYTGYSKEELLEMSAFDLLTPAGKIAFASRMQSLLNGELVSPSMEYQIVTKYGTLMWCELHMRYLTDKDGAIWGAFVIITDITARKNAELLLMEAKNKAQMYLDMAFNIFVALDTQGKITLINQAGCDVLGIDECFLIGEDWFTFISPEDRVEVREAFNVVLKDTNLNDTICESSVINRRGEHRFIRWRNRAIKDGDNKIIGVFASGEDITEERELEHQQALRWDKIEARLVDNLDTLKRRLPDSRVPSITSKIQRIIEQL